MNNQLISFGSKGIFLLELKSNKLDYKIGEIQFWINNCCLGRKEETYILPNLLAMRKIENLSSFRSLNVNENSYKTVFAKILNDEKLSKLSLLGFGETFDDYVFRVFIFDSNVIFLWTFLPQEIKTVRKKPLKVECGVINSDYYFTTLNECLNTIYPNIPIAK